MAKSSAPLLVLLGLGWSAAGAAQPGSPPSLVEAQQARVRNMIRPRCVSDDPEEITVCGRRDDRGPRGPLPAIPYAPEPGTIRADAQAGGEQRAALANEGCIQRCHQPVQIDIIGAIGRIGEAITNLSDD